MTVLFIYSKESPRECEHCFPGCPALCHLLVSIPEASLVISYRVPDDAPRVMSCSWESLKTMAFLGDQTPGSSRPPLGAIKHKC